MQRRGAERGVNDVVICVDDRGASTHEEPPKSGKVRAWLHRAKGYFHEYCENTSLHGLRYLGERHRPLSERLCWLALIVSCIVVCSLLIANLWHKWQTSPVIVSFSETWTSVREIPFPAVTVCSEVKIKQTAFNYSRVLVNANRTEEENDMMEKLGILCTDEFIQHKFEQMFASDNITELIAQVAPSPEESMPGCWWLDDGGLCAELFDPVFTDEGLCYTFNTMKLWHIFREGTLQGNHTIVDDPDAPLLWSPDNGYPDGVRFVKSYPSRTNTAGSHAGLYIVLDAQTNDVDPLCTVPSRGFKVLLHNPAEFPQVTSQFIRVPLNRDVVLGVRPRVMTTSTSLLNYSPDKRKCYFSFERQLTFFAIYTQDNCELECVTNYTLQKCDCVAYHMPRKLNTRICGSGSKPCMDKAPGELLENETIVSQCKCLPACTEISYDVEMSHAELDWGRTLPYTHDNNATERLRKSSNYGQVSIYFKERQFLTSHRSELYGKTDFLANCGGLLGLYMGFSILSLAEIVYFLSVKLWCGNSNSSSYRLGWVAAHWQAISNKLSASPIPV